MIASFLSQLFSMLGWLGPFGLIYMIMATWYIYNGRVMKVRLNLSDAGFLSDVSRKNLFHFERPATFTTQTNTPFFRWMKKTTSFCLPYTMLILMGEEKAGHGRSVCYYGKSKYPTLKQSICYLFIQDESSTNLQLMWKIQSIMTLVSTLVLTLSSSFFFFLFFFLFYNNLSCQLRSGNQSYLSKKGFLILLLQSRLISP